MLRLFGLLLAFVLSGQMALANAPSYSLRPLARPITQAYVPRQTTVPVYYNARIRPVPRPYAARSAQPMIAHDLRPDVAIFIGPPGLAKSLRPLPRPRNMRRIIAPANTAPEMVTPARVGREVRGPRRGSVCGDRAIRGQAIAPVRGRGACGIRNPVRVTAVDGVALTTPATIDCNTAKALKRWVHSGAKPAVGRMGGGIKSLRIVASYACRTRNSQSGAKISEHAYGRAVDIAAINLKNGRSLTVLNGWRDRRQGPVLKRMHRAACGPFGTVLGPNANRYHQDHFHFDTARYRSGSYCR